MCTITESCVFLTTLLVLIVFKPLLFIYLDNALLIFSDFLETILFINIVFGGCYFALSCLNLTRFAIGKVCGALFLTFYKLYVALP